MRISTTGLIIGYLYGDGRKSNHAFGGAVIGEGVELWVGVGLRANINLVFVSGISGLGSIQSTVDQFYNYVFVVLCSHGTSDAKNTVDVAYYKEVRFDARI